MCGAASGASVPGETSGDAGGGPYPEGMSTAPDREPAARPPAALVFDDPLDRPSADDSDHTWGDRPGGPAADLARFLDEKPPHHL